ncbi:MAG TPA: PDZ domain-containing protein [Pyrinomonadaceae bacterium]|nr:PDZ domain-containing protein [Pyrinomonadaceae bacterium]
MNMRNLLPLFASLLLCSGGIVLQAQTAATPQAQPAPPAPPASAVAPEAPQDAAPAVALLMEEGNFLGILPGDVTRENMGRYGLREPRGVLVTKVIESSPAAHAGLKEGDVILRFNNEIVASVRQLNRLINEAAPEQTVRLSISRQGSEQEINATLARRKDFPSLQGALPHVEMLRALPQEDALRALRDGLPKGDNLTFALGTTRRIGVGTAQLTKQLADYFGVTGGRGVLVTSVNENSPAARAGLKAGDVITEVDGQQTGTVGELMRALNRQSEGEVTINLIRDKHQRTLKVTPERGQLVPFSGPDELFMPQIGTLAIPHIDMSRMVLPVLPKINFAIPRMNFPNIQKFKLAPMNLPAFKLLTPKIAPLPM